MNKVRPTCPDFGRYCLAETARELGVSRKTVWAKEKEGLWKPRKAKNGKKFYYGSDIKKIWDNGL